MPHDPELIAETRGWLGRAASDLRAAEVDPGADPPLTADLVFHAQQAAEKPITAFLTWNSQVFRKTHNLTEIGEAAATIDPSLEPLLRKASPLTEYAWKFRYPGEPEQPSREEAVGALGVARDLYEAVLARVAPAAKP